MINTTYYLFLYNFWPFVLLCLMGSYDLKPTTTNRIVYMMNSLLLGLIVAGIIIGTNWKATDSLKLDRMIVDLLDGGFGLLSSMLLFYQYIRSDGDEGKGGKVWILTIYCLILSRCLVTPLTICTLVGTWEIDILIYSQLILTFAIFPIVYLLFSRCMRAMRKVLFVFGSVVLMTRSVKLIQVSNWMDILIYSNNLLGSAMNTTATAITGNNSTSSAIGSQILFHLGGLYGNFYLADIFLIILVIESIMLCVVVSKYRKL
jgi:hypothetical protein